MKYAVVRVSNGNFSIASEHDELNAAQTNFYNQAAALSNSPDVITAHVRVVDENCNTIGSLAASISHPDVE